MRLVNISEPITNTQIQQRMTMTWMVIQLKLQTPQVRITNYKKNILRNPKTVHSHSNQALTKAKDMVKIKFHNNGMKMQNWPLWHMLMHLVMNLKPNTIWKASQIILAKTMMYLRTCTVMMKLLTITLTAKSQNSMRKLDQTINPIPNKNNSRTKITKTKLIRMINKYLKSNIIKRKK